MQGKTRIVHLPHGRRRADAENSETCILGFDQGIREDLFRTLFLEHYTFIRKVCTGFAQPGLAMIAIDITRGAPVGSMCLAAKVGAPNAAIIGRHNMVDLYLTGDASLSLRHLAVVLSPLASARAEVRFRILDLRTAMAFQDEHGQRFEALMAEGPLFVRCGRYALFCIPTGDTTAWPERDEDGWACIPERVYLHGAEAEPDRWERQRARRRVGAGKKRGRPRPPEASAGNGAITLVRTMAGPVRARTQLVAPGEGPLGSLWISSRAGVQSVDFGRQAAQQGILLGRYARCDIDGANMLTHDGISRVHLLVIDIEQRLYAIDTGSTHGTWSSDEDSAIRIAPLVAGTKLILGPKLATLQWRPA